MASKAPEDALSQFDPGKIQTDIGFYETLFHLHDQKAQHCIPAIVKKYDRASGKVTVQPIVKYICDTPRGTECFSRPEYDVRVRRICHGGFTVDIPLFAGDTGWLIAGDRHADDVILNNSSQILKDQEFEEDSAATKNSENRGELPPDDRSLGDFAWGFFIPDYWGDIGLKKEDGIVIKYMKEDEGAGKPFTISCNKDAIIVKRGNDGEEDAEKIILDDDGISYIGKEDRTQRVVTDIRYDLVTHQIQKKTIEQKIRGDFVVGVGEESEWTMVDGGQAVPET